MPDISVIICTHNPRLDNLTQTIESLKAQTLPREQWELLIVDNASQEPLAKIWDLSWHPHARHVRENELGLTMARLRGMKESTGELLVFVDDDNVLAPDYLWAAAKLVLEFPQLGAFGAGKISPVYERAPRAEFECYSQHLALREQKTDLWTNLPVITEALPYGAGLCVRRKVAAEYRRKKASGGLLYGRVGQNLMSAEDIEIALLAPQLGFGYGVFVRLSVQHLIPAVRVEEKYLLRLVEGMELSNSLLQMQNDLERGLAPVSYKRELRLLAGCLKTAIFAPGVHRRFHFRRLVGRWRAFRMYRRILRAGNAVSKS